jgi:hypothetical protein
MMYANGYGDGAKWARDKAEADQLDRLSQLCSSTEWHGFFSGGSNHTHGDHLCWYMDPEGDRVRFEAFWRDVAGPSGYELSADRDYVQGFAEGAVAVWREEEGRL